MSATRKFSVVALEVGRLFDFLPLNNREKRSVQPFGMIVPRPTGAGERQLACAYEI